MTAKVMYFKYFQLISRALIDAIACICVCLYDSGYRASYIVTAHRNAIYTIYKKRLLAVVYWSLFSNSLWIIVLYVVTLLCLKLPVFLVLHIWLNKAVISLGYDIFMIVLDFILKHSWVEGHSEHRQQNNLMTPSDIQALF